MSEPLDKQIATKIREIAKSKLNLEIEHVDFEIPNNIKHGNLSTNIALKNSKVIKKNPMELAKIFADNIDGDENIKHIEVVKPGFINFYFSNLYFAKNLKNLLENGYRFEKTNQNINVEFVSANPTGELHLGHARNAVFGDSLANLLQKVGNNVIKEYYINDAGVQMQNLGKSVRAYYLQNFSDEPFPDDGYKGQEIKDMANKLYSIDGESLKDETPEFFIEYGYNYNMDQIKKVLKSINVEFDVYSSEKYYHDKGLVKNAVQALEKNGEIYVNDGAKWLNTTKYGDDKDRVLEKGDGTHTYLTSDIAYHDDKFKRTNGILINIWGADHHGYLKRVEAAMESLGYNIEKLQIIFIQMVSVLENNEKIKMSKRAGTSVTIKDLLKEVDSDVLRYFFIMRSPDTQLDFDISLAHEQNSKNPIFYIQYAHARISSLLKKAKTNENDKYLINYQLLTEEEIALIYEMMKYKNILQEAAKERRVHLLTNYIYDLSSLFHKYYNNEQILSENQEEQNNKLGICLAVKNTIADCLEIIGIKAKETM